MSPRGFFSALVLTALIIGPSMAAAQPYQYNTNYNNARQISGSITSVQGSSITLADGNTVFLHQGTVVNPPGTRLQAGMQITVTGVPSGNLRFNADQIEITCSNNCYNNGNYNNGNGNYGNCYNTNGNYNNGNNGNYNNGNNGNYNNGCNNNGYNNNAHRVTGTIASVQGSSITLAGGRVVFLHQGTIIKPNGVHLRSGMDVTVTGVRSGRLRFNADEIDVTRRHHQDD